MLSSLQRSTSQQLLNDSRTSVCQLIRHGQCAAWAIVVADKASEREESGSVNFQPRNNRAHEVKEICSDQEREWRRGKPRYHRCSIAVHVRGCVILDRWGRPRSERHGGFGSFGEQEPTSAASDRSGMRSKISGVKSFTLVRIASDM